MQLTVLGLNHRTAPVEIRERFNFSNDRVASILRRLRNYDNIPEAMLLSTCNRTELYMVIENPHEAIPFIKSLLKHLAGEHYQSDYFYNLNGTNCVKHLFRVASSLDSLIVGEGQILSQIKNAYQIARNNGMTDTILNTIMNKAIAVGKRVRTETKIAYSSVSVSSAAVDLAIKILGDLSKAQILVVGAGHMSELTALFASATVTTKERRIWQASSTVRLFPTVLCSSMPLMPILSLPLPVRRITCLP